MTDQIEDWFDQADHLLFNENNHDGAQKLFERILHEDPMNIDAINSIAYCIKSRAGSQLPFDELKTLYERSLKLDNEDIEANFNLGLLYLEKGELDLALKHLQTSVEKDVPTNK